MIVKMKKLTLLCLETERTRTLKALRDLGVMHIQPVVPPSGGHLETAKKRAATLQRLLTALPKVKDAAPTGRTPRDVFQAVEELLELKRQNQDRMDALKTEIGRMEPFGSFSPEAIQDLKQKGIILKLYRAPLKATPDLPEGVSAEMLGSDKKDGCWALFGTHDFEWPGAEEIRLPTRSLDEMKQEVERLKEANAAAEHKLVESAGDRAILQDLWEQAAAAAKFEEVNAGMGAEDMVTYLRGFVPVDDVEKVRAAAQDESWGLVVDDPGPEDDVPVKLKQPRWSRPIQAVFDGINILPAYNEADVSGVFMIFFCLFFAMIIGDAGYGLIFLALTLLLRKKLPKNAVNLLMITSVATIIWGFATGTFFGLGEGGLDKLGLDKLKVPFLTNDRATPNLMGMCFLIGAIQITVGHLWNFWDLLKEKSTKALEQLGWTMTTWYMFFLADSMVLKGNMVSYIGSPKALVPFTGSPVDWMAIVGILLIACFMMKPSEIKDGWFNLALLPLNLVNNFTDVVSYVRLYAVGAAGFAVANAFNTMLFGGELSWWRAIISVVLVFFAHVLNILLCVMGVLVHAIRLNTLEFSNHKGITWSGSPYRPFANTDKKAA